VECNGEGGLFRTSNCFRQRFSTDDTDASTIYYPVASMECAAAAVSTLTGTTLAACAAACDALGAGVCGGFNMGNDACDETGTCRSRDTCTLVAPDTCHTALRPVATDDFYWNLVRCFVCRRVVARGVALRGVCVCVYASGRMAVCGPHLAGVSSSDLGLDS
jgi:hypothetical protein